MRSQIREKVSPESLALNTARVLERYRAAACAALELISASRRVLVIPPQYFYFHQIVCRSFVHRRLLRVEKVCAVAADELDDSRADGRRRKHTQARLERQAECDFKYQFAVPRVRNCFCATLSPFCCAAITFFLSSDKERKDELIR
jgi:hypothetical protein